MVSLLSSHRKTERSDRPDPPPYLKYLLSKKVVNLVEKDPKAQLCVLHIWRNHSLSVRSVESVSHNGSGDPLVGTRSIKDKDIEIARKIHHTSGVMDSENWKQVLSLLQGFSEFPELPVDEIGIQMGIEVSDQTMLPFITRIEMTIASKGQEEIESGAYLEDGPYPFGRGGDMYL